MKLNDKLTYKLWVNKTGNNFGGSYYIFKTFKVYWAYRWYKAMELDNKGFVRKLQGLLDSIVHTNYADRYN